MKQSLYRMPATAAALAILLAACGGGSGSSDSAVSSSPSPSSTPGSAGTLTATDSTTGAATTTQAGTGGTGDATATNTAANSATNAAAPASNAATAATGSTANDSPAGAAAGTAAAAPASAPVTQTEALTAAGINGALLAGLLDQVSGMAGMRSTPAAGSSSSVHGPRENAADAPYITTLVRLDPFNYSSERIANTAYDRLVYHPLDGQAEFQLGNAVQGRDGNKQATLPFRTMQLSVPFSASATQVSLGQYLTLGTGPTLTTYDKETDPAKTSEALSASAAYTVQKDQRIPFGTVAQWNGPGGSVKLEVAQCSLVALNGDQVDTSQPVQQGVETCWDVNLPNMKRRTCHAWQVPASESNGMQGTLATMVFHGIADDRSTYAGENGVRYWVEGGHRCQGR